MTSKIWKWCILSLWNHYHVKNSCWWLQ